MENDEKQHQPTLSQHDWKQLLRSTGDTRKAVTFRLFSWFTNAPNLPYRLDAVVENMIGVLKAALDQWTPETPDAPFPGNKILRIILRLEELRNTLNSFNPTLQIESTQERGYALEDHALYACLSCTHQHKEPAYRLLQAHLLFAACLTELQRRSWKQYEQGDAAGKDRLFNEQYRPSLIVRQLAHAGSWQNKILDALDSSLPPVQFAAQKSAELESDAARSSEFYQIRLGYISSYVKQAHGIRARIERTGTVHTKHAVPVHIFPRDPDDQFVKFGNLDLEFHGGRPMGGGARKKGSDPEEQLPEEPVPPLLFTLAPGDADEETEKEALENDHCPNEFEEEVFICWSVDDDQVFEDSPGSYQGFSAAQINHLIKSTKVFPFGCDHLAPEELIVVEVDFRAEIEEGLRAAGSVEALAALEPKMIALVMLWTCRSLENVLELVEIDDEDDCPDADIACVRSRGNRIRVAVSFPDYATQQNRVDGQEKKLTQFFLMPDSADLARLLGEFSAKQAAFGLPNTKRRKLFNRAQSYYKKELKSLFGQPERQARRCERVTLTKLASALYVRIFNATGKDITATTIISGKETHLSRVPMFYVCRSHERIEEIYDEVVLKFRHEICRAADYLQQVVVQ